MEMQKKTSRTSWIGGGYLFENHKTYQHTNCFEGGNRMSLSVLQCPSLYFISFYYALLF